MIDKNVLSQYARFGNLIDEGILKFSNCTFTAAQGHKVRTARAWFQQACGAQSFTLVSPRIWGEVKLREIGRSLARFLAFPLRAGGESVADELARLQENYLDYLGAVLLAGFSSKVLRVLDLLRYT